MATLSSSSLEHAVTTRRDVAGSFLETIRRRLTHLRFGPAVRPLQGEAIAVLSDSSSTADMRDWAERYLCGMTIAGAATYLEQRLRQA